MKGSNLYKKLSKHGVKIKRDRFFVYFDMAAMDDTSKQLTPYVTYGDVDNGEAITTQITFTKKVLIEQINTVLYINLSKIIQKVLHSSCIFPQHP